MELNWIDWAIIVILILNMFLGLKRGFIIQILDILGILVGLYLGFSYYEEAGNWLYGAIPIQIPPFIWNIIGFVLLFVLGKLIFVIIGGLLGKVDKLPGVSWVNSFTGAVFWLIKGVILICVLLLLLDAFQVTPFKEPMQNSKLIPTFEGYTAVIYSAVAKIMPEDIPRIFVTGQGMELKKIDFKQLDGATCIECGGKVKYLGYQRGETLYAPKFVCQTCGRISDGCQTYEGFHALFGECPVAKGREGIPLNCDVWMNSSDVLVKGPCPVCGDRL